MSQHSEGSLGIHLLWSGYGRRTSRLPALGSFPDRAGPGGGAWRGGAGGGAGEPRDALTGGAASAAGFTRCRENPRQQKARAAAVAAAQRSEVKPRSPALRSPPEPGFLEPVSESQAGRGRLAGPGLVRRPPALCAGVPTRRLGGGGAG